AEGSYIPPGETIEVLATVMNVGLNEEFITVKGKAIRQSGTPVTHPFKEEKTDLLDPGDKEQVAFSWTLPIGTYNYKIEIWVEIDKDGEPDNNLLFRYIRAQKLYDISILSLYADPVVQDVARARAVTAEVKNIGNIDLENIVEITFEAFLEGSTEPVDEYTTTISLQREESSPVTWDWQSFKYGEYTLKVEGKILDSEGNNLDTNTGDNTDTIPGIITVETIFSDTREAGDSPFYLEHDTGEYRVWDHAEMDYFWTGQNESDDNKAGWHVDNTGHYSRYSWYGGIPARGRYANNMEDYLYSKPLNLLGYENVHLSFYTTYVLEGRQYDYVEIAITNNADDEESWSRLVKFPADDESHDSSREPGNEYGWLHKNVLIPNSFIGETFYIRILLKTDNGITYRGVWIDDLTLYGTTTANHAPVARFTATYENASYSRNVVMNPTINLLHIKGNYAYNNLPRPIGDKQGGIPLEAEIQFDAGLCFDPDAGDNYIAYTWDFGDDTTESGKIVTHAYEGDIPAEGYFVVKLKAADTHGAYSTDTMFVWIGNKAPEADFIVTPYFDLSLPINDTNDRVVNGVIDVFYGDRIVFQQRAFDPENDLLTYDWEFKCNRTGHMTEATGDTVSGMVGTDFLSDGPDHSKPVPNTNPMDYAVTILVSDGTSVSTKTYTIRVHPYAEEDFTKPVELGATLLTAEVTLVWRGFLEEAASESYMVPERPVFVYIETATSPDLNLANRGGIGLVYSIRAVGVYLQNGDEGFIEATIKIPILVSDVNEIGDWLSLKGDLRLEYYDKVEKRFVAVEDSHLLSEGEKKYVVGEVEEHFSLYTAIVDSIYNTANPNHASVLPDLSIFKIEFSRAPAQNGQDVEVRVRVKNSGKIHARNVDVKIYDGDNLIGDQRIDIVKAGGGLVTVKETFNASMLDPTQQKEIHQIKAYVNKQHAINEGPGNYKNNQDQEPLDVTALQQSTQSFESSSMMMVVSVAMVALASMVAMKLRRKKEEE
ncbi:MAG: PKD domain-containing protein, partial [Thermoplasmata archaeon]|nr:PKD domain-containing protein [Thermoplasmata archaeon]